MSGLVTEGQVYRAVDGIAVRRRYGRRRTLKVLSVVGGTAICRDLNIPPLTPLVRLDALTDRDRFEPVEAPA